MGVCCTKVQRYKGQPYDAGGVHGEPDKLGLVEVLRNFPCFDGVDGAHGDQDHAVDLEQNDVKTVKRGRSECCLGGR